MCPHESFGRGGRLIRRPAPKGRTNDGSPALAFGKFHLLGRRATRARRTCPRAGEDCAAVPFAAEDSN
jgi:hypothetical protein